MALGLSASMLGMGSSIDGGQDPGNSLTFQGGSSLTDNGSGQLTIAAGGSNQNILLAPTGTGIVKVVGTSQPGTIGLYFNTTQGGILEYDTGTGGLLMQSNNAIKFNTGTGLALTLANDKTATFAAGVVGTGATGGTQGAGTGNFSALYVNGVAVGTSTGNVSTTGSPSAGQIAVFTNGTTIQGLGPIVTSNTLTSAASNDLTLAAGATNQSVNLVPSGTGLVNINATNNNAALVFNRLGTNAGISSVNGTSFGGLSLNTSGSTSGTSISVGPVTPATHASGTIGYFNIIAAYNQTSGTAANTDLLINRTQTAVGSGTQLLIDAQVNSTSKFSVNNTGKMLSAGTFQSSDQIIAQNGFAGNTLGSASSPTFAFNVTTLNNAGMYSAGNATLNFSTGGTLALTLNGSQNAAFAGTITLLGGATFLTTSTALTNGAGVGAGTLLTAPVAGNPTKWIGINDNGTTRYIPAW